MRVVRRAAKRALLLAGCSALALCATATIVEAKQPFLFPGSLVVSTTTYSNSHGAVASLTANVTQLAGSSGPPVTCSVASAGNDYVNVWNNDITDGSFGVTSEITLTDINPGNGNVLATLNVPTNQVVTSFSSKSEMGLHFTVGPNGPLLSFVGYGGAGIGALDVSNSDAVPGQDPSNPVTGCFGSNNNYAFPRTIVSVSKNGTLAYTPTIAYGGNNGRSALFSPDAGYYYTVGNSNNGNASTFTGNGTNPNVTETTGLEVVNPLNWPTYNYGTIPNGNSEQADPLLDYPLGKKGALDKAGKDSNFRGIIENSGALYFTKGSGTNGVDTIYSVTPGTPTLSNASGANVIIPTGFPTDSARATGGNFTPFGLFFANATTLYVADEGSGNSTDTSQNAGLEKWSLVNGTWQLDYVLINNLIGTSYNLTGYDGAYPAVTTVGLRNLSGVVNGNNVTLWATTSTSSTSGDQGADPNEVVTITDNLSATTLSQVSGESFSVVGAPTYGSVYRGVAYIND
jgi:hypothetical protein